MSTELYQTHTLTAPLLILLQKEEDLVARLMLPDLGLMSSIHPGDCLLFCSYTAPTPTIRCHDETVDGTLILQGSAHYRVRDVLDNGDLEITHCPRIVER